MELKTPIRTIETVKTKDANGSKVQFVDADTQEVIYQVCRPFSHLKEYYLMRGKNESFSNIQLWSMNRSGIHKGILEDICGEYEHVDGWGSRSLNPNFNMYQECTFKGLVKLGKHLAQFEKYNFEERTHLMHSGALKTEWM